MKFDNSKFDKNGELKNGHFQEFFKNGAIACEGDYKDGERTGEWKYYLLNGIIKAIGNYTLGKMTGEWKWYHVNGILNQVGTFENELKTGVWTRYYDNGQLWDETEFKAGKKVKILRVFDKFGNEKAKK
ncbi:MAG: hypothetical protein A2X13_10670 [Bacteroidetes bacterium GWC2_33_15]|nr:MAG: hypothetical protein A2X10_03220 [Bacteroidetes bacterium GWA2_33_15]OFX48861.1 MAG: hypothetical protein A2X13_10670 [Bacteroidetes bacterium GWC2_33_15]OFX66104.1 MAG: hypothetical protein A2X15_11815 [Bacteroidetes bacterium GWB2_32_14]OFX68134.1 MAG: hypothetical protein A2X14_07080 [Bacteroidetes bacterium GWD2_33_33]HAN17906.1 hypothetical protein [Bacteroidales bacterium]